VACKQNVTPLPFCNWIDLWGLYFGSVVLFNPCYWYVKTSDTKICYATNIIGSLGELSHHGPDDPYKQFPTSASLPVPSPDGFRQRRMQPLGGWIFFFLYKHAIFHHICYPMNKYFDSFGIPWHTGLAAEHPESLKQPLLLTAPPPHH
jgi:hypothetical protein